MGLGLGFGLGFRFRFRVRVRVRSKRAFHGERWRTTYGAPSISIQPVNGSVYLVRGGVRARARVRVRVRVRVRAP